MSDDSHAKDPQAKDSPAEGDRKHHGHGSERSGWAPLDRSKGAPPPTRSGKTMHHPAFRIGEIKHGK